MLEHLECQQCKGQMGKDSIKTGSAALGIVLFVIGLALLFAFPLGTVAGLALWVLASRVANKKRNVWKCGNCGYIFDRA